MAFKRDNGMNFLDTLGLIFVVLKLCGLINWSWFYVALPFLIPIIFFLIAGFVTVCLNKNRHN